MRFSKRWFILMPVLFFSFQVADLLELRKAYHVAIYDGKKADIFCKELAKVSNPSPMQKGYMGAGKMLLAKNAFSPISKFNLFTEGKLLLDGSIKNAPNEIELRYLRYSIQLNCPAFLNYDSNRNEDRSFILKQLPSLKDRDLKTRIIAFMASSGNLSSAEREALQ
jgi:hypothetical protein